ncbi:MAG: LysE family translocator [Paenibacillaceae bacterium]|uniref:LysE family translocator n=1 Tax=Paenibacillus mellifer TaxID=2937794 RepID=A0A9X1XVT2_9BACL|nr:LysE family transporter [Paenibacillus mellifer]MBW4838077.1 LysE family translocator [Paenibacillaceae bacterium]MCK8486940.1 LysE family translocator [Paenibacillus mellifer]
MRGNASLLLRGFKFGMLLQLAVGPVCLFIFQTGSRQGYGAAATGVLGVTLVDAMFMGAAMLGVSTLLGRGRIRSILKWCSVIVVGLFGFSTVLSAFPMEMEMEMEMETEALPFLSLPKLDFDGSYGVYAFLLTASNPLTILFWAGVFGSKITEPGLDLSRSRLRWFALGALLATFGFLNLIALIGSLANAYIPPHLTGGLNLIVGLVLIAYALRMAITRHKP